MYDGNYLAERLSAPGAAAPDAPFIVAHGGRQAHTYADFFAATDRLAAALVRAGVKPGDRVAIQAPKTVEMLELYLAAVLAGAVFLPLNPAYTASEVRYFLNDAEPALLVCDPARLSEFSVMATQAGVGTIWTLGQDGRGSLRDARDAEPPGFCAVARAKDDLAALLYTSGTTGRSKGAMLSHFALASNASALMAYWEFTPGDVLIHALPIFHTHGLFVATNTIMMAGSAMIFMAKFDADAVVAAMPMATTLMGVPTFYVRLLETKGLARAARDLRLFVSGSAPLLAETHDRWRTVTGHAILERYGMTETNMNTSNPYLGERRAGTVGFPLPGVSLVVSDPISGDLLANGEIGMIEVRGPNLFTGYWRMPEKTAEELRENGYFITGDLGKIDEQGYVHIVGRNKDLVISGGFNIYPKEVEQILDALSGVQESAVIGVPHPDFGEAVVAVLVADPDHVSEAFVLAQISGELARFKQPKRVIVVDELPRNAMGKVQKKTLREQYAHLFAVKKDAT